MSIQIKFSTNARLKEITATMTL